MSDDPGGPYLQAAVLCEKVIEDKEGILSLIQIIDRTTVTVQGPDAPEKMPPVPLNAQLVLMFKTGFAKGSHQVKIRAKTPDGVPLPEVSLPIHLEGDDRGTNLILPVQLVLKEEGLYWFDIFIGERLVTRVPFRLVYRRISIRR